MDTFWFYDKKAVSSSVDKHDNISTFYKKNNNLKKYYTQLMFSLNLFIITDIFYLEIKPVSIANYVI